MSLLASVSSAARTANLPRVAQTPRPQRRTALIQRYGCRMVRSLAPPGASSRPTAAASRLLPPPAAGVHLAARHAAHAGWPSPPAWTASSRSWRSCRTPATSCSRVGGEARVARRHGCCFALWLCRPSCCRSPPLLPCRLPAGPFALCWCPHAASSLPCRHRQPTGAPTVCGPRML